jgi:hypothetical protein
MGVSGDRNSQSVFSLETTVRLASGRAVKCRVLDAQQCNLNPLSRQYTLSQLKRCPVKQISYQKNRLDYLALLHVQMYGDSRSTTQDATELLDKAMMSSTEYQQVVSTYPVLRNEGRDLSGSAARKLQRTLLARLGPVDALFHLQKFVEFLYEAIDEESVDGLDTLNMICNVPRLDNAFFTGQYMVMGNGENYFYPLISGDVVAHELSHGLVQGLAGLEYKGHSGALNEAFSDIVALCYEYWIEHTVDPRGDADWFIGEELGVTMPYLRSFSDPESAQQPSSYQREPYYMDPNGNVDYGGVHVNSGIINHCFYRLIVDGKVPMLNALRIFVDCLRSLSQTSNFMAFRNKLADAAYETGNVDYYQATGHALAAVGLDGHATSDQHGDEPQPQQQREMPQSKEGEEQQQVPQEDDDDDDDDMSDASSAGGISVQSGDCSDNDDDVSEAGNDIPPRRRGDKIIVYCNCKCQCNKN